MGMTHIKLGPASEDAQAGTLQTAWKLRIEKNAKSSKKPRAWTKRIGITKVRRRKRRRSSSRRAAKPTMEPISLPLICDPETHEALQFQSDAIVDVRSGTTLPAVLVDRIVDNSCQRMG